jgi:hypothetical protein
MLAEWLFVETVVDVRRRSHHPAARNRYELLGIAPLLRKLLIDSRPLLNTVQAARLDVVTDFRIKPWSAPDDSQSSAEFSYHLQLGGPELVGGPEEPRARKLKHFLSATVGFIEGKPLTVREVVRYYAHVEGGVHFGVPASDEERVLNMMAPLLLGRSTGQIQILAHLGTIVVNALTPLCESILASPLIDTRMHRPKSRGYFDGHWTAAYFEKPRHS